MTYSTNTICAGLAAGKAPAFLASMLTLDDGQVNVTTEKGAAGLLSIDTFQGQRTSVFEFRQEGVINRITAMADHFLFEQIALRGSGVQMTERLDYERVCEPNPTDPIQEWLEAIQS